MTNRKFVKLAFYLRFSGDLNRGFKGWWGSIGWFGIFKKTIFYHH